MSIKLDIRNLPAPLTEGGEGIIYELPSNIIFKKYKDTVNKDEKMHKLIELHKKNLPNNVIGPIDIVTDMSGNFCGYTMKKIKAEDFKKLSNKKFIKMNNINIKDILKMLIQIKDTLKILNSMAIYIGDLNDRNILFDKDFNVYFIDVDSWSVDNYRCDVCMDLFKDPCLVRNNFNASTDAYAFAVLAFKSLTRLHPFGGVMTPEMDILDRMKNRLSVLKKDIKVTIPKIVDDFKFISPKLLNELSDIFDNNKRGLINESLDDFGQHLEFCTKHNNFYYSKYKECPICSGNTDVVVAPIKQKMDGNIPYITLVSNKNIKIIINEYIYMNNNNEIIHNPSNKKCNYILGEKYNFSNNGDIKYIIKDDKLVINDKYEFEKQFKSNVTINNDKVYYINKKNILVELTVTSMGNSETKLSNTALSCIFEANDKNNYFICNTFNGLKIININGNNYEFKNSDKIINYGIHFDKISGHWLFIYENQKGKFNTMIFKNNKLIYQNDSIIYTSNLSNFCFSNNIIFKPDKGKIVGFAYDKNICKDFVCNIINEDTKLLRPNNKFIAINEKEIYLIG